MVRYDFLTPEQLRVDGRRPQEIRPIECHSGDVVKGADGSASISMGLTKAVAYVYGPRPLNKRFQNSSGEAVVCVEYRTATFGAIDRRRKSKGDRQSLEKAVWLQRTFEEVILTDQFPKSQIEIFVEIIQQDGSSVSAAINAVTLALVNAGIPMKDMVASCTLGLVDRKFILVDLNQSETEKGTGSAQICMATYGRTGQISLCEVESKIPVSSFHEALKVGTLSCSETIQIMRAHIAEYAESRFANFQ